MKSRFLLPILALAAFASPLVAQEPKKAVETPAASGRKGPKVDPDPTQALLEKLKPEQREKVKKAVNEASTYVAGIRLQEALARLSEAEAIEPGLFVVHNLKGAVYTKMRDFAKARSAFEKAEQLNPQSYHPKFNLAELDFVEKKFEKALAAFDKLLAHPQADDSTKKLIQFKQVICYLKLEKKDEAEKLIKSFSYIDDEPVFYMSHAAKEFAAGKREEAQSYIDSANRIYSAEALTIYFDSFIEMGWVETLTQ